MTAFRTSSIPSPVLAEIDNRHQIEDIIKSTVENENDIRDYKKLRMIGEKSHATLVLQLEAVKVLDDEYVEGLINKLKNDLCRHIPIIKDVRINIIVRSD